MSIMSAMGPCISCGQIFTFNPYRVPSSTALTGKREPVCQTCFHRINEKRRTMGLEPFEALPGAYDGEEVGY